MSDSAVVLPVLQPLPAASKADYLFIGPFQEGVYDRSEQLPERVKVSSHNQQNEQEEQRGEYLGHDVPGCRMRISLLGRCFSRGRSRGNLLWIKNFLMTHCQRLLRVRGDLGKWRWGIKSRDGEWVGKISHLDQAMRQFSK